MLAVDYARMRGSSLEFTLACLECISRILIVPWGLYFLYNVLT